MTDDHIISVLRNAILIKVNYLQEGIGANHGDLNVLILGYTPDSCYPVKVIVQKPRMHGDGTCTLRWVWDVHTIEWLQSSIVEPDSLDVPAIEALNSLLMTDHDILVNRIWEANHNWEELLETIDRPQIKVEDGAHPLNTFLA